MATIQGIYIALFGRPADPLGLAYFNQVTQNGADLTAIGDLAATAEYQSRFEGMTNVQIVNSIYQSLFGRDADLAGLTFFTTALQNGTYNINNIAIAIYDGAQGNDAEVLANKEAAANLFTASLDTGAEVVAYQGDGAAAQGRAFLSGVTSDDSTIPTQAEVDAAIEAIVESPAGEGITLTLTDSVDELTGSAGNDTFRAVTLDALDSTDILDGGAGQDVLNISANGIAAGANAPVITSIETINNADADGLDLGQVTGLTRLNSSVSATYSNAALATVFAATLSGTTQTIAYDADLSGSTTINLATDIDSAVGSATFEVGAVAVAELIEHVNLEVSGDSDDVTTVTLDADLDNLESITVTGNGDLILAAVEATLETFTSTSTGNVQVDLSLSTELTTVTTGAGADSVTLAGQEDVTVNVGAGNDAVNLGGGEQGLSLTLGAGTDSVLFAAVATNIADADEADFAADIIQIADFNGSDDFLDLGGANVLTLTNPQLGGIEGQANLYDAVVEAAGYTVGGDLAEDAVVFQFSGNTYIYIDSDDDGAFTVGDGLVELTGFTGDLTASNFLA